MSKKNLKPLVIVNGLSFYKFNFLDLHVAILPEKGIDEVAQIWSQRVTGEEIAADLLKILVMQGPKWGIQVLVYVIHPEAELPEHPLTKVLLANMKRKDDLFVGQACDLTSYIPGNVTKYFLS